MTAFFFELVLFVPAVDGVVPLGFGAARRGVFEAARPAAVVLMLGSLFEFENRGGRARPPQARKFPAKAWPRPQPSRLRAMMCFWMWLVPS